MAQVLFLLLWYLKLYLEIVPALSLFLAALLRIQDPISAARDRSYAPCIGSRVSTMGPSEKSLPSFIFCWFMSKYKGQPYK